jgi:threonyl-tRNA synthetase
MVHRALLGSMERFFGGLVEHYAGAFPVWLAPVQVKVLPIADRHHDYARSVVARLRVAGARAEMDGRAERMQAKIRDGEMQKIPYLLVVGDREMQNDTASVRKRGEGDLGAKPVSEFLEMLRPELEAPGG